MTSTTGTGEHPTGEHPEVSEISDLTDGLLSPSRSADVREHLVGCPLCDDVYASLEEIRALLGTLPGPVRMPADVSGRIDAALAAEALLDATAPGGAGAHVSRETATLPVTVSRETDELPRGATPPARPSGRPRGSSGPGRQSPGVRSSRARRWPRILLSSAAAAAVFSFGGLLIQNAAVDGTQAKSPGRTTATPKETTDRAAGLTAASLGSHVHDLLAAKGSHKSPEIGTRTSPESTLRGGADTIPSCVRLGIKRMETPLASSHTRYQGKDAYLVVLPNPTDPKRVSAYVVSSSCVSATPPAPGKVLLSHSYQRD
ncbi:anti-sigma factor family protein [Streptomyces decoyicus]|uniref:anti-sigma factor family protein n=1 Tax=Streptomyces decoyicus TaxID=249567 RepID=UPI0004AA0C8D|nr:zf-HC2 domain-containing protein [Streptomyces decoyicus]KOG38711.1 membrane protein [Streptomyces decoyicus]QZY17102.1 zf-HC2 domain-containing protein [Streptomyces decoyicus]